jgi:DeoR/GlpR family transcriptional regulator of sugar metabolism
MLAEQRRRVILDELEAVGSVYVATLSERLRVSDMTIRRDLEELSGRGLLKKVHGGAVPVMNGEAEPHFIQKRKLNRPEKSAIARVAAGLVEDGDTVAFSAGTTTWHVAAALRPGHKDLAFITNSTNIALTLQENGWEMIVLSGGVFRTPSDALVGAFANQTLGALNADILFLGVHGADPETGLTTPNTAEAETNRCLIEGSRKVVVVADHTKLGVVALAKIAPLSSVHTLITDDKASPETLREIEGASVEVIQTSPPDTS